MKKLDQNGLIPLLLCIIGIVAAIIYFALPAAGNPGFFIVLGIFLMSFSAALLSTAPGGLGVLELVFVNGLPDDESDLAIARAIIQLGLALHLRVIAEGVETERQMNCLQLIHIASGYVVAALIVFRLLYLIIPFALSLIVVLVFEKRSLSAGR